MWLDLPGAQYPYGVVIPEVPAGSVGRVFSKPGDGVTGFSVSNETLIYNGSPDGMLPNPSFLPPSKPGDDDNETTTATATTKDKVRTGWLMNGNYYVAPNHQVSGLAESTTRSTCSTESTPTRLISLTPTVWRSPCALSKRYCTDLGGPLVRVAGARGICLVVC